MKKPLRSLQCPPISLQCLPCEVCENKACKPFWGTGSLVSSKWQMVNLMNKCWVIFPLAPRPPLPSSGTDSEEASVEIVSSEFFSKLFSYESLSKTGGRRLMGIEEEIAPTMLYCWSVHSDSLEHTLHKGGSKATWDSRVHLFKKSSPHREMKKAKQRERGNLSWI